MLPGFRDNSMPSRSTECHCHPHSRSTGSSVFAGVAAFPSRTQFTLQHLEHRWSTTGHLQRQATLRQFVPPFLDYTEAMTRVWTLRSHLRIRRFALLARHTSTPSIQVPDTDF